MAISEERFDSLSTTIKLSYGVLKLAHTTNNTEKEVKKLEDVIDQLWEALKHQCVEVTEMERKNEDK